MSRQHFQIIPEFPEMLEFFLFKQSTLNFLKQMAGPLPYFQHQHHTHLALSGLQIV